MSAASPLTQKPQQARRRFRQDGGLFRHDRLGPAHRRRPPGARHGVLFGIAFGLLIERAQICFTSAFRDMWITGRTVMAKAIIFGMAASAIGIFSYVQLGMAPKIMWAGPNAAIGGLLFGFGIVLAGGCETGWMYRAVEGGFTTGGLGWATSSAQRCSHGAGTISPPRSPPTGRKSTC